MLEYLRNVRKRFKGIPTRFVEFDLKYFLKDEDEWEQLEMNTATPFDE